MSRFAGALILLFVAACTVLHIIQPDLNPLHDAVSYYMNGSAGWLLSIGLVALGAGSMLLAFDLRNAPLPRAGRILLALWSLGAILGGLFPPDPRGHWDQPPSTSGLIHGLAAMIAFVSFPIAALLLSKDHARLRRLARLSALAIVIFFGTFLPALQNRPPYGLGLAERVALAIFVCWLLTQTRRAAKSV